tara:strand:- start:5175 stop:5720 length:546 start_codon:yes stop_codon:yes gene_type:complete
MVRVRGQLDAPLLDVGAVKEDYWERKEILLPSLSRLFKPKGWRKYFFKQQAPKIVIKRLTQSDWQEIEDKNFALRAEINEESIKLTPLINQYTAGKELSEGDLQKINNLGIKMRPITYSMLQTIIVEPVMSYEEVTMMMEILDDFDCDTLLSYVSMMTSEKASVMKRIYDKRMREAEMISQ